MMNANDDTLVPVMLKEQVTYKRKIKNKKSWASDWRISKCAATETTATTANRTHPYFFLCQGYH